MEPLVSIILPIYNAGAYLRPAVESVLGQTYGNLEILAIDDGSSDGCLDSITDLRNARLRILSQPNSGRAAALNRGLELASGELYAIQDADDLSYPQRIQRLVQCMQQHPDVAAVFSGHDLIIGKRRLAPRFATKTVADCRRDIDELRMPAHDPTGMYRVSRVKEMRYEPSLRVGAGLDYILRVGEVFPMMVHGECLYSYRVHFQATTRSNFERRREMLQRVIARAAQRRGGSPDFEPSDRPTLGHREREYGMVPHFMESVLDFRRCGRVGNALRVAWECARLHPLDPLYYKPLGYAIAPRSLIDTYRRRKSVQYSPGPGLGPRSVGGIPDPG